MADITQFKALTGADDATAKYYLNKTNPRNLQVAVNFFFDAGGTSSRKRSHASIAHTIGL